MFSRICPISRSMTTLMVLSSFPLKGSDKIRLR